MYRLFFLLIVISAVQAKDITGDWHGKIDVMGQELRISFHIKKENSEYISTMDSPDQGAFDLPTSSTTFIENTVIIDMKNLGAQFEGQVKQTTIEGTFSQNGMKFALNLSPQEQEKPKQMIRPQDPVEPLGYKSEDITFVNHSADSIELAGTLTFPNDATNPPAVVLISGSGPQNRNEELTQFNHRPFLVLSDYLTKNGIAVLRYDDRGVGKSEGQFKGSTSADFATDVEAAVDYLKSRTDIDTSKIGLIGHSEGGLIAPMVAAKREDIAFIVMLAGPGVDGATILTSQAKKAAELNGDSAEKISFNEQLSKNVFDIVKAETHSDSLKSKLKAFIDNEIKNSPKQLTKEYTKEVIEKQIEMLSSNWFKYFIKTDPEQFLSKVKCPVLALNGEKDFQVLPELNLSAINKILSKSGNKDYTIRQLKDMNHLFQVSETGALSEYGQIEETFSPVALKIISEWIWKRVR